MRWQYTPYLPPIVVAAISTSYITQLAWRRRSVRGATALSGLSFATCIWLVGYALELISVDPTVKLFWARFQYLGITAVPILWLTFALHFAEQDRWITPRTVVVGAIIPVVTLGLVWTHGWHQWIWNRVSLDPKGSVPALELGHAPGFWVYWGFAQAVLAAGTVVIGRALRTASRIYRWQSICLLAGVLAPWIGNGIYILGIGPFRNLDLTPFGFTVSGAAFAWSLFQFHLLDIIPVAQRRVIEGMRDGVLVFDNADRVVQLNPSACEILGREAPRVIGNKLTEVVAPWAPLFHRQSADAEAQFEIVQGRGSSLRHYELWIAPLWDGRRVRAGRLAVLRDVTEHKRAEAMLARARDEALEASRLKTELLAKVSHELRTPLGVILGFTEMLHIGAYGPLNAEQTEVADDVIGATRDLTRLVNEFLEQAQLEAGRAKLSLASFAVGDLLDRPLSPLRAQAKAKGLSLTTRVSGELPALVVGDRSRLEQILINLVGNAIKYTSSGGVDVELLRSSPTHWALQVADTGVGIPSEAQSYIFEPFGQVDGSSTRRHGGVGLGLSIVKQFAGLMGGRVDLHSTPGLGSTFTVTLPLAQSLQN